MNEQQNEINNVGLHYLSRTTAFQIRPGNFVVGKLNKEGDLSFAKVFVRESGARKHAVNRPTASVYEVVSRDQMIATLRKLS